MIGKAWFIKRVPPPRTIKQSTAPYVLNYFSFLISPFCERYKSKAALLCILSTRCSISASFTAFFAAFVLFTHSWGNAYFDLCLRVLALHLVSIFFIQKSKCFTSPSGLASLHTILLLAWYKSVSCLTRARSMCEHVCICSSFTWPIACLVSAWLSRTQAPFSRIGAA